MGGGIGDTKAGTEKMEKARGGDHSPPLAPEPYQALPDTARSGSDGEAWRGNPRDYCVTTLRLIVEPALYRMSE